MTTTSNESDTRSLDVDTLIPGDVRRRQGDHLFYADGTPVVMRWAGGERHGTAAGLAPGTVYDWQVVEWADGTRDKVAPHVLERATGGATHEVAVS